MTTSNPRDAVFVERFELGGDGLRVGIKDSIDVAGYATRLGSAAFAHAPPAARHAAVVQTLLDGGCRIVGKTGMHELAYGVTGINRCSGTPRNPRYPDRIPGGSSSGSAVAVALGAQGYPSVDFALGTDTGGSIRIPATCCGVFGLKPTYGRVSRAGVHPAFSSLDCVGPFAATLSMLERAMSLMDPTFHIVTPPRNVRLGMLNVAADSQVVAAVRGALGRAGLGSAGRGGAGQSDVGHASGAITATTIDIPSFHDAYAAGLAIISAENWAAFGHLVDNTALGDDVRARLVTSRDVSRETVADAERCRARLQAELDAALSDVDALVLPTLPDVPPTLDATSDARTVLRLTALVRPFNVSGHPALTLPLQTHTHLPAGLQLIGRRGGDAALCALAHRLIDR